jgi:hypothetical protein
MPTVFTFFGLRFAFFSNDHTPVHIHVIKGKGKMVDFAIYQIVPKIKLLKNSGLKSTELKLAELVIEENIDVIIDSWNRFFNNQNNE